jgi:hypothetical protein
MNTYLVDSNKVRISEAEIVNIVIEFLSDGRPVSECRGHLLSEYAVNASDLVRPLEEARRQVRACEVEFCTRLRF